MLEGGGLERILNNDPKYRRRNRRRIVDHPSRRKRLLATSYYAVFGSEKSPETFGLEHLGEMEKFG